MKLKVYIMLVGIIIESCGINRLEKLEEMAKYFEESTCKHCNWLITKQYGLQLRLFCESNIYVRKKNPLSKFEFNIYICGHLDIQFKDEYEKAKEDGYLVSSNYN